MKFLLVCCAVVWPLVSLLAQPGRDSLLLQIEQIRKLPPDTAQVNKLRLLAGKITESDTALSRMLMHEALSKSLQVKEPNTITDCYRLLGVWCSSFGLKDSALYYYRKSIESAAGNKNLFLMAGAQFNMGNVFFWKGQYDSCIQYYQKAALIFEGDEILKDKNVTEKQLDRRKSDLYGNMSNVFSAMKNLPKADAYIDKAIAIARKYTSPMAADALANYMQSKADNYTANGYPEKAIQIRLQFLQQMQEGQNAKIYLQHSYHRISKEYFTLGKIDSSKWYADKSFELATAIKVPEAIAAASWQLGKLAMAGKDYKLAEKYLSQTKTYYENAEDPLEQQSYYDAMRELSYHLGNYKEAYEYFDKYKAINDSILLSEQSKTFAEREMRYETDKKESQIRLQQSEIKQKSFFNYLLIGSSLALVIILLLTYRNYKSRQQLQQQRINELETEKQLSATQYLLKGQEDERSRLAKDLHDGLGGLLSGVKLQLGAMKGNLILSTDNAMAFDRALSKLDESISEMRRVAHNMMPEVLITTGLQQAVEDYCDHLAHNQPFTINCELHGLENRMESAVEIVVYRIVQELLNNAVKHSAASVILVQIIRPDSDYIAITVEDNGKGFDPEKTNTTQTAGMRNIRSRVNYLNGTMDIKSAPGNGTSIFIECKTGNSGKN